MFTRNSQFSLFPLLKRFVVIDYSNIPIEEVGGLGLFLSTFVLKRLYENELYSYWLPAVQPSHLSGDVAWLCGGPDGLLT